jgi:hypothetical protein
VVPIIEETPGGAPLSAQDGVHRHAGSLRGGSKRRFRRIEESAELLPVALTFRFLGMVSTAERVPPTPEGTLSNTKSVDPRHSIARDECPLRVRWAIRPLVVLRSLQLDQGRRPNGP